MGNGISEALKIKIFWWSMLPHPARGSRLRRSFHYALLCVPKRKNHATPLDCQYWAPNVVAKVKKGKKEDEMSLFTLMLSLRTVWKLWWISEILSVPLRKFMWICQKKDSCSPNQGVESKPPVLSSYEHRTLDPCESLSNFRELYAQSLLITHVGAKFIIFLSQ